MTPWRVRLGLLGPGQPFRTTITRRDGVVCRSSRQLRDESVLVRLGDSRRFVSVWLWVEVQRGQ